MNNDFEKKLIYIIDDEPDICSFLKDSIELNLNINVKTFTLSNDVLLEIQKGNIPNLIVTDLRMPVMGGMILLEKIRALKLDKPAIILSGYADKQDAIKSLNLKVNYILDKPITIDEFIFSVTKSLAKEELFCILENLIEKKNDLIQNLSKFIDANQERIYYAENNLFNFNNSTQENKLEIKTLLKNIKKSTELDIKISSIQESIVELYQKRDSLLEKYSL